MAPQAAVEAVTGVLEQSLDVRRSPYVLPLKIGNAVEVLQQFGQRQRRRLDLGRALNVHGLRDPPSCNFRTGAHVSLDDSLRAGIISAAG